MALDSFQQSSHGGAPIQCDIAGAVGKILVLRRSQSVPKYVPAAQVRVKQSESITCSPGVSNESLVSVCCRRNDSTLT